MLELNGYAAGIPAALAGAYALPETDPVQPNPAARPAAAAETAPVVAEPVSGLIARELPKLKRLAWMLVRDDDHANDLVQDTVVRVLTYANSWQPGTNFGAWVKTIMRNQFYTECSQRSRESKIVVPQDDSHDSPVAPVQDERLACNELTQAIDRLPRNQRIAVRLAAFEGLTSEEIAARMNITPNAARCHLMRGRKQLRALRAQPKETGLLETDMAETDLVGSFG
jgi:RNA polymerase sigma-70 factor, ECF subfamily